MVLNTHAIPCDGVFYKHWHNPYDQTIHIRRVYIWHGATYNAVVDMSTGLYRARDAMLIAQFVQDRYANPSGATEQVTDFGSHSMSVPVDGSLSAHYFCQPVSALAQAHHIVIVWFTFEP